MTTPDTGACRCDDCRRRGPPLTRHLPADVRAVLREFPGISVVRATQIVADRRTVRERAGRQAYRNRLGEQPFGGIDPFSRNLVVSFDNVAGEPEWWGIDWGSGPDQTAGYLQESYETEIAGGLL